MNKALIPIMSAVLIATMFTGCRRNVATETEPTKNTTQATAATTQPTTRPTEASRHTQPSTDAQRPSILPETSDATGETGRERRMPPRY